MTYQKNKSLRKYFHIIALILPLLVFMFFIYAYFFNTFSNYVEIGIILVGLVLLFEWTDEYLNRVNKNKN